VLLLRYWPTTNETDTSTLLMLKIIKGTIGRNSCNGDSIEGPEGYIGYNCHAATGTIG
jgi:hypothetical protein